MKDRIRKILAKISDKAFEREEAIALSLLSALSGESIFLLGLPGVGKSMIARRLKYAFEEATVFEYLMSRFSTPDEIFGPVSIAGLKDNDIYERVTTGFLPEAEVIFLDEIWKAGPAIQNSLLTVLNEKIFLNGNREMKLPAKVIIAASNELPAAGEGLEALWDRFLIRYIVEPIKMKDNFFKLIQGDGGQIKEGRKNAEKLPYQPISAEEFENIRQSAKVIDLPQAICELLYSIREKLNSVVSKSEDINDFPEDEEKEKGDFYISDRRWKKSVGILKTSACLNGRKAVDLTDMLLLSHILWNDDTKIPEVNRILSECIVSALFSGLITNFRCEVNRRQTVDRKPFSSDGKHYTIECDDYPLKISKEDYDKMKRSPNEYFFGIETKDAHLLIRDQGQYVVRFVREGVININSYNYNMKSMDDTADTVPFSAEELELKADWLMRDFENRIEDNIFIARPPVLDAVILSAKLYRERFSKL